MIIFNRRILKRAIVIMAPFLFIACEKPNEGLGFNQVIGSYADLDVLAFDSIISYTQGIDSLLVATDETQSSFGGYTGSRLVGSITDGHFGRTEASFVSEMILEDIDPNFGTNPVVDSVYLFLRYNGSYGDTSVPMNLEVYNLAEVIRPNGVVLDVDSNVVDSAYYSNYQPVEGEVIGGIQNFIPRPGVNVRIENALTGPTLKIPMDLNYFQQNFADVGNGSFAPFTTNSEFRKYFKGIHVKTTNTDGAILYFNLNTSNSRIKIYFHSDEDSTAQSVEMNFSQASSIQPVSFSIFNNDYSGTYPVSFDLNNINTTTGEPVTYVQAMGGVATVLEIPGLEDLRDSSILINQAILEIRKEMGTGLALAPPPSLEIREFTGRGPGASIRDFAAGNQGRGDGAFRSEEIKDGYYRFNITRYIFDVVNTGETKKLAVVPVSKSVAANRVILQGGYGAHAPVRLKIYYTKP